MTGRVPFTGFSRPRSTQGPDSAGLDLAAVRAARVAHTAGAIRADGATAVTGEAGVRTDAVPTLPTLPTVSLEIPTRATRSEPVESASPTTGAIPAPSRTDSAPLPVVEAEPAPAAEPATGSVAVSPQTGAQPVLEAPREGEPSPEAAPDSTAVPAVAADPGEPSLSEPATTEADLRAAVAETPASPPAADDAWADVATTGGTPIVEGEIVKPRVSLGTRPTSTQLPTGAAPTNDDRDDLERAVDLRVSGPALMTLATHPRAVVRAAVAARTDCPTTALVSLSHDQAPEVLIALLSNPRTPASTVRNLADHRNTKVADIAVQRLRNQYR